MVDQPRPVMNSNIDKSDLFKGIVFFLDPSLPDTSVDVLKALLLLNGAKIASPTTPNLDHVLSSINRHTDRTHVSEVDLQPPIASLKPRFDLTTTTHIITNSLHLPEYKALGFSDNDFGDLLAFCYTPLTTSSSGSPENSIRSGLNPTNDASGSAHKLTDRLIHLVTPLWVHQSFDVNKLLLPAAYSPDPYKFFSGIVIALDSGAQLPTADIDMIRACVPAWGGQFRNGLTQEVTHLLCAHEDSKDYKIANNVKDTLGLKIVLPHWFHYCVFFRMLIPEASFQFPSPPILNSVSSSATPDLQHGFLGVSGSLLPSPKTLLDDPDVEQVAHKCASHLAFAQSQGLSEYLDFEKTRVDLLETGQMGLSSSRPLQQTSADAPQLHMSIKDRVIFLAPSLGLSLLARKTLVRRLEQIGCKVFDGSEYILDPNPTGSERSEKQKQRDLASEADLMASDILICENRAGWEYWLAWDMEKTIGTLHWILVILNSASSPTRSIKPPTQRLLDFPTPCEQIDGWDAGKSVTTTNYSGSARAYVIRLLEKMQIPYNSSLDSKTAMVVAANKAGSKAAHAAKRRLQLVNHIYIEECFLSWSKLPIEPVHHTFHDGVNLCELVGHQMRHLEAVGQWTKRPEVKEQKRRDMSRLPSKRYGNLVGGSHNHCLLQPLESGDMSVSSPIEPNTASSKKVNAAIEKDSTDEYNKDKQGIGLELAPLNPPPWGADGGQGAPFPTKNNSTRPIKKKPRLISETIESSLDSVSDAAVEPGADIDTDQLREALSRDAEETGPQDKRICGSHDPVVINEPRSPSEPSPKAAESPLEAGPQDQHDHGRGNSVVNNDPTPPGASTPRMADSSMDGLGSAGESSLEAGRADVNDVGREDPVASNDPSPRDAPTPRMAGDLIETKLQDLPDDGSDPCVVADEPVSDPSRRRSITQTDKEPIKYVNQSSVKRRLICDGRQSRGVSSGESFDTGDEDLDGQQRGSGKKRRRSPVEVSKSSSTPIELSETEDDDEDDDDDAEQRRKSNKKNRKSTTECLKTDSKTAVASEAKRKGRQEHASGEKRGKSPIEVDQPGRSLAESSGVEDLQDGQHALERSETICSPAHGLASDNGEKAVINGATKPVLASATKTPIHRASSKAKNRAQAQVPMSPDARSDVNSERGTGETRDPKSATRSSTRRVAKLAAQKVSACSEDMNVYEKEKKRKRGVGIGLAGDGDGGYFGDLGGRQGETGSSRKTARSSASRASSAAHLTERVTPRGQTKEEDIIELDSDEDELPELPHVKKLVFARKSKAKQEQPADEPADAKGQVERKKREGMSVPTSSRARGSARKTNSKSKGQDEVEQDSDEEILPQVADKKPVSAKKIEREEHVTEEVGGNTKKRGRALAPSSSLASRHKGKAKENEKHSRQSSKTGVCILQAGEKISERLVNKLRTIGATFTDTTEEFTHLLTNKIARTDKLFMAIIKGSHVVSHAWAEECCRTGEFVDEDSYLLKDKNGERQHGFSLKESVKRARQTKLLEGLRFYVSPKVNPNVKLLQQLIEAAGGKVITKAPLVKDIRNYPAQTRLVISCLEDSEFWKPLMKRVEDEEPIRIYETGLVTQALLTQKLDFQKKFELDTSMKTSTKSSKR